MFCEDCGKSSVCHINTWLDELMGRFSFLYLPKKADLVFSFLLEKFFLFSGSCSFKENFFLSDIQPRTACFIREAKKRGVKFQVLHGPFGYTGYFKAEIDDRTFGFNGLPLADFASKNDTELVDDKNLTKERLKKGNFPVAEGRSFWFWQKVKAVEYGSSTLGFPLVVKPRGGSVARHVTTDIKDEDKLYDAIAKSVEYSPVFIVERFIENSYVFRATVVDFDYVAVVGQVRANVAGDGSSTIRQLVEMKNSDERRGEPHQKEFILHKVAVDETTTKLLAEKNYDLQTIPARGEVFYLQKDPFLKLGGDLIEVTEKVHSENVQLFKDVAKLFDIRLVGIDFLAPDISVSWKNQKCAVLELNSIPCIEMHHYPSSGDPQNVAGAVVDLFFKYYL